MITIYLKDAPRRIESIRAGMAGGDAAKVASAAHAFKSSSANLGATALAEMCKSLERHCRGGSTAGAEVLVGTIEHELAQVTSELQRRAHEAET